MELSKKEKKTIYKLWENMNARCYYKKRKNYNRYGGRGIVVCNEWKKTSKNFIKWCLRNGWRKELQIDRVNNDGNYSPENCRFVAPSFNSVNRDKTKLNKSGYVGVSLYKKKQTYRSEVSFKNKTYLLGYFETKEEAVRRRNMFILLNNLPHKIQEVI